MRTVNRNSTMLALVALLAALFWGAPAFAQTGDPAKEILQLTGGARTKIVWSRGVDRPGGFSIMLLDTSEGRERVLATQSHCRVPFITPSGNRVIVDDMEAGAAAKKRIYVMDMNGKNRKVLGPAYCAMGVAEDPPGTEWAYYADAQSDANPRGRLWRVQIDNPTVREMVWDKTSICWQWAFTRDGKVAAGALPWPGAHIANLPNGSYQQIHDSGCMVALAPSGTRMLHCTALQFGGEHRGIGVHSAPNWSSCVLINLGAAPGVNNQTLLWPAWALYDERFFVIAGPNAPPRPRNILFGQFNAEFNGIANWVQVTQCPEGFNDCNPSCWIQSEPGVKDSAKMDPIETKPAEDNAAAGGWPADRKDLIFLWENRKGAFLAYDREGEAIPSLILMPRDLARFDHNQGLWLEAGAFPLPDEVKLLPAQKPANLTLEAYLTPGQANGASLAEIISFSAKSDDANLVLGQLGDRLVMAMKGGKKPSELCTLTAGEPVHVIVTYAPEKLACYKNGKLAAVVGNFQGSPAKWTEQHLLFGSNWDGKNPWSGHLEGIAIYTRALGRKEAEREHAAFAEKLKDRKPVPMIEIQAKLLAKTKAPKFEEIAPYTQATAAYEYEVEKVVSGQCKETKIRVVHHTMIDRKMLPASQAEIGKSYTLLLEPYEANPQLDIDLPLDDLPLDLNAVLYYDVGPLSKTP